MFFGVNTFFILNKSFTSGGKRADARACGTEPGGAREAAEDGVKGYAAF